MTNVPFHQKMEVIYENNLCPRCGGLVGPDIDPESPYRYECLICKRRFMGDEEGISVTHGTIYTAVKETCAKNTCGKAEANDSVFCPKHRNQRQEANDKQREKKGFPPPVRKDPMIDINGTAGIADINKAIESLQIKMDVLIKAKEILSGEGR